MIVYHHRDADGYCAAAIIKDLYPDAVCIDVQYGDVPDWDLCHEDFCRGQDVWVVDFSFSPEDMSRLHKEFSMVWVDHHKSAMEKMPELWNDENISGNRSMDGSGAMLTYNLLHGGDAPLIVRLVDDYDRWVFADVRTRAFHEYASAKLKTVDEWVSALKGDFEGRPVNEMITIGTYLLDSKNSRVDYALRGALYITFCNVPAKICNSTNDVSEVGSRAAVLGRIGIVWSVRNDVVVFSLRSKGDVDVSEIARTLGGGGHKCAAGFRMPLVEGLQQLRCLYG